LTSPTTTTRSGRIRGEHPFQLDQHLPDLGRLPAAGAGERDVGWREVQLRKELLRHRRVVMLSGVDEEGREHVRTCSLRGEHRGHFDQVRPGPDDVDHPTQSALATTLSVRLSTKAIATGGERRVGGMGVFRPCPAASPRVLLNPQ
jgi:hypothetical protein